MQKHLSDCSSHYACLCVTEGEKAIELRRMDSRGGVLNAYTSVCLPDP